MTELNHDLFGNVVTPPTVKMSKPPRRPVSKKNPNQMFLFATGDEIMNHVEDSVDAGADTPESMRALWREKRSEAWDMGYPDKFAKQGIQRPITIEYRGRGRFVMGQGHHRVAAAHELNRIRGQNLSIPVVYDSDFDYTGTAGSNHTLYHAEYPFGSEGRYHEFAKGAPPGKWAGLTAKQVDKNAEEYYKNKE